MLYGLILALHIFVCVSLMISVLLQSGKGGGLAGAFGGGAGTQAIFGGRGAATFLSNATTILGVAFMVTSLTLALLGGAGPGTRTRSLIRDDLQKTEPQSTERPSAGLPSTSTPSAGGAGTAVPGAPAQPQAASPTPPGATGPASQGKTPATGTASPTGGSQPAGSPR